MIGTTIQWKMCRIPSAKKFNYFASYQMHTFQMHFRLMDKPTTIQKNTNSHPIEVKIVRNSQVHAILM